MRRRLLTLVSFTWLLGLCVLAQSQQPPTTPPPQTPPPQTPPPTSPPPSQPPSSGTGTTTPQENARSPFEFARPIYLKGCVRLDNGSVPAEPVRIWLARPGSGGGVPRAGGIEVDLRGCFNVRIGIAGVRTSDPRLAGAKTSEDMYGWEVRAEIPGYGGGSVVIREHTTFLDIDVGTIVLTPFPNVDPGTISLNSLSAPRDAREAYMKARGALERKEPDPSKAMKELRKAVARYSQYASAWQLLGEVYENQKDESQARQSFEKAISADPQYLTPYLSLGNIELRNQRWTELAKLSETLLQLSPVSVEGWYFQAVSNYSLQNFEIAEKSARFLIDKEQGEKYPSVHLILGDIVSQRGDVVQAAAELRTFLSLRPGGQNADRVRSRLRAWEQQGLLPRH